METNKVRGKGMVEGDRELLEDGKHIYLEVWEGFVEKWLRLYQKNVDII